ncbi:MAG: pyridoxal phosphate-dependent aminotransferase [Muribaculaceae bacterium]|nr:pyridoxal phosphate-dependent aminotransferase [Muribaculaceae bacterium]
MENKFPVADGVLDAILDNLEIPDISSATIRQICAVAERLEQAAGEKIVHLELGNPGLPAEQVGIECECRALRSGIANKYPDIAGVPALKRAGKDFIKAFLDIDLEERGVVPTVGSMQASFTLMLLLRQRLAERDTLLLINPGFPAQRHQAKLLGMRTRSFDIYEYRGAALEAKLEEELKSGRVTAMIYSNPNNPAWTNLTDQELEIIGRMATKHDVIVLEDLAYMGMDFRKDFGKPSQPPYIPTVAKYTDNYILLVSASKIFSYAGQRIAIVGMSPEVYRRHYPYFESFYEMPAFGDAYIYGVLYCASSGAAHSAQYALAGMMESAVRGELNFVDHTSEYGRRAGIVKRLFADNGFHLVYAIDGELPIADGFFFTVGYPGMTGVELQRQLLKHGISTISLPSTGSEQEGVRVTISTVITPEDMATLGSRLARFHEEMQKKAQNP